MTFAKVDRLEELDLLEVERIEHGWLQSFSCFTEFPYCLILYSPEKL